jgi:iron complex outermembrane receptor protein
MPAPRAALLLACGLAAAASAVRAQTAAEPQRVEIVAGDDSDEDKRRREPVAKTIVGREELDRYGDLSVSDVLRRLPGVTLQGGSPRLRGLGAGYTLILVNGEPAPPGFSLENLSPAMVERIEVSKGPTAEHSAQAVAGTINIVLRQALRQRQRELRLNLGYNAGRPAPAAHLQWSDRLGPWSLSLPLGAYQWRGRSGSHAESLTRDGNGQPQATVQDGSSDWSGGGANTAPRLVWKPDESWSLDWQSFAQRNESRSHPTLHTAVLAGEPPPSVDDDSRSRGRWQVLRSSVQLGLRPAAGWRLEARLGGQATHNQFSTRLLGDDEQGRPSVERLTASDSRERSGNTSGKLSLPWGDDHALALGWELEQRRQHDRRAVTENGQPQLVGFEGEPFEARISRSALYAQDEWQLSPRWSAYLGLRAERIVTRSLGVGFEQQSTSQVLTPLLHLNLKPRAGERDLIRASLTRSYRAPELQQLVARPSIAGSYPASGGNTELAPDRIGNPVLRPELATGLDLAYEHYPAGGGVVSVGFFHRRLTGLMRNQVSLQDVAWSPQPRWVAMPVNLAGGRSTGLELEAKGRADQLLPGLATAAAARDWSLRASLALYRSQVRGIAGPDNRLEGQPPGSLTLGLDRLAAGDPLGLGVSLAWTPGYAVQQSDIQRLALNADRRIDAYARWAFSRDAVLRLSVGNAWPVARDSRLTVWDGSGGTLSQHSRNWGWAWFNANLSLKF